MILWPHQACGWKIFNKLKVYCTLSNKISVSVKHFPSSSPIQTHTDALLHLLFREKCRKVRYSPPRLRSRWRRDRLETRFLVADFDDVFQLPGKWSVQSLWRPFQPAGDVRCSAEHVVKDQGLFSYSAPEHKQSSLKGEIGREKYGGEKRKKQQGEWVKRDLVTTNTLVVINVITLYYII